MDIQLPDEHGVLSRYILTGTPIAETPLGKNSCRIVLSAAHVVADPFTAQDPSGPAAVDWKATMADANGLLRDPDLEITRMRKLIGLYGL